MNESQPNQLARIEANTLKNQARISQQDKLIRKLIQDVNNQEKTIVRLAKLFAMHGGEK